MMGRLRESKWVYVLLSVLLAVLFWFYVRAEVDPTQPYTIHNVRVELTGTNVLTSQGLTVAGLSTETVNLRIEAPTSVAGQPAEEPFKSLYPSGCFPLCGGGE